MRVLLVEDNPGDARLAQIALSDAEGDSGRPARIEVLLAVTLHEAIAKATEQTLDVALVDLTLPDSAGLDTFLRLRAAAPDLPVVVITGLSDDSIAAEAVRRGAQDFLVKGAVDGPLLMRSLQYAIARSRADRERVHNEFLTAAAHELKTPLTSLRGTAQLTLRRLEREGELSAERLHAALSTIERQSDRLARLVSQLLDVSRIEDGGLPLELEHAGLLPIAEHVMEAASHGTARHELRLDAGSPEEHLQIEMDPLRIEQVLMNLVDNAIKFSPAGGPVSMEVVRESPQFVRVTVRDRGIGVHPDRRGTLFERRLRPDPDFGGPRPTTLAGMGLGLYLSKRIVDQHGGEIEASFPDDGGTAFTVRLPATVSEATLNQGGGADGEPAAAAQGASVPPAVERASA